ncbi:MULTISPECIES: potassium channel protein [unclassified Pseudodesulfovibrio]|uniref:potassium channel family protein n=1 Tax=unclassified Pseudodesulfovibrio TaxID=2661612 RepID=UPI000FEBD033|nr:MULTISPECIES: potassium channel protein [unclassified Pseudodesulfovibrio]MCJ2163676.1 potassium channel protein [Pseudodesulfovibrio sp. S3-i]RWU06065.1 potassium channel protein [Pseudodesulfovibrio sp. S3]
MIGLVHQRMLRLRAKLGSFWNIILGVFYLLVIFIVGIGFYMLYEHWDFASSFYMVVITLSTVGFMEVNELSGEGRIFTAFLIMGGVGGFVYIAGAFAQLLIEGRLQILWGRHKMMKDISKLRNHFIVCGHGRIGSIVVQEIRAEGLGVVVIESDPDLIDKMEQEGILCIEGDATSDEVLMSAGLLHAKSLISAVTSEAANVYVTLTARQLNPDIIIVARAGDKSHISRLELAGANRVVLPHFIGGLRMAQSVLRPTVTNFLELAVRGGIDLQMEELPVSPSSELVDKDLIESKIRANFNLIIIAIKKESGEMVFNPGPKEVINANDTLLAVGKKKNLADLKEIL